MEERERAVERMAFVEEQNVRRSLAPALWASLCTEIEKECAHANEVVSDKFQVTARPTVLTVKHLPNAKTLRLEYEDVSACISVQESEGPLKHITFRVDPRPSPSLMPMYENFPIQVKDLAYKLVLDTTRNS